MISLYYAHGEGGEEKGGRGDVRGLEGERLWGKGGETERERKRQREREREREPWRKRSGKKEKKQRT